MSEETEKLQELSAQALVIGFEIAVKNCNHTQAIRWANTHLLRLSPLRFLSECITPFAAPVSCNLKSSQFVQLSSA